MEQIRPTELDEVIEAVTSLVSSALTDSPGPTLLTDLGVLNLVTATDELVSLVEAVRAVAIREMVEREAAENEAHCVPAEYLHRGLGHTIQRCRMIVKDSVRGGQYARLVDAQANATVSSEQATAIAQTLALLPDDLGTEVFERCEATLIDLAETLDPGDLLRAGWRVLEHEAPDRAEAILADRLAAEQERARKNRGLSLTDDGHGTTHVKGRLPTADGEELAAVLNAHADGMWRQQIDDEAVERAPRNKRLLLADSLMALSGPTKPTVRLRPTVGTDPGSP